LREGGRKEKKHIVTRFNELYYSKLSLLGTDYEDKEGKTSKADFFR
jgi:hypothetical protein